MMKQTSSISNKKKIQILFKVIGSPEIGLGHVMRSMELAREFKKNPETEVFFYCNQNAVVISKLARNFTVFVGDMEDSQDRKILSLIDRCNFDVVIIDHMGVNPVLCSAIKSQNPAILVVVLDTIDYSDENIDIIINLFNHNLEIPHPGAFFSGNYFEGLQYAILRDSFLPLIKKERRVSTIPDTILIAYGGADKNHYTITAINRMETWWRDARFKVVVGALNRDYEAIENLSKDNPRYTVFCDNPEIQDIMDTADLGFVGSGTTLLELCSLGVPAVVTPQNEFERRFSDYIEKNNACLVLSEADMQKPLNEALMEKILDTETRRNMSIHQKNLVDGRGKERIVHIIMSSLGGP